MTQRNYYTLKDLNSTIKNSEEITTIYRKVILRQRLSKMEYNLLLRLIAFLFYMGDKPSMKAAYMLALHYGIKHDDYEILLHLAIALRYYPVVKLLQKYDSKYNLSIINPTNEILYKALASISLANDTGYQLSDQQYWLNLAVNSQENAAIIAPTSCGKSSLLIDKCLRQYANGNTVCIIVPTKSLLTQTLHDVISKKGNRRDIITHPEMLTKKLASSPFIAILTQERLLAVLVQHKQIKFNYIFVDEAHNLLPDDESQRARIIARALIMAKVRNEKLKIDFYSPFLITPQESLTSISSLFRPQISYSIDEHMKIPQFMILENQTNRLKIYDQFSNAFYETDSKYADYLDVILKRSGAKNIIYANKPADIEKLSNILLHETSAIQYDQKDQKQIDEACVFLKQTVDASYLPISLLKHGIVMSHGKMPDLIKNYMEHLYKNIPKIRFMITTSTLLEGVNMPAEKLFMLSSKRGRRNLSYSNFHNLAGRIGRYNTIFSDNDPNPKLLAPEIYILYNTVFAPKSNFKTFLKANANEAAQGQQKDDVENPLLNLSLKPDEKRNEINIIANMDKNNLRAYRNLASNIQTTKTEFGEQCCLYNVFTPYIEKHEEEINHFLKNKATKNGLIETGNELLSCISKIFNNDLSSNSSGWLRSLADRYKYKAYADIINQKTSNDNYFTLTVVNSIVSWKQCIGKKVYVGSIGNEPKDESQQNQYRNYHTFTQADANLIPSYAVALAKDKFDNVEQFIMPYVEILHNFNCIEEHFYKKLKYGTDDDLIIALICLGLDFGIAKIIGKNEHLRNLFTYNTGLNEITYDKEIVISAMYENDIVPFYISLATETL